MPASVSAPTMPPVAAPAGHADRGGGQPTRGYDRPEAGNSQQAEPGKQAGCATDARADTGAFAGSFGTIVDTVAVAVNLLVGAEPAVRIIRPRG